jgi:hypothetical protein
MSEPAGLQLKPGLEASLDTLGPEAAVLKTACDKAYKNCGTSCSHAANHVIREVHKLSEADWPHRQANPLVDYLVANWTEVNLERAYELAQRGSVVVGGKKEKSKNGHVIVVYPGTKRPRGGYDYIYEGKLTKMRETGLFPRAMSTSNGAWPGAKSCGEKTVWDPWGNDTTFKSVKFWTRKIDAAANANVAALVSARRMA